MDPCTFTFSIRKLCTLISENCHFIGYDIDASFGDPVKEGLVEM